MVSRSNNSKAYASEIVNDLALHQQYRASTNWLLSYLDVFVLVVMLMVTLLTLSEIKKPQTAPKVPSQGAGQTASQPHPEAITKKALQVTANRAPEIAKPAPAPQKTASAPTDKDINRAEQEQQLQLQQIYQQKLGQLGLEHAIQMTINKGFAQLEIQDRVLFASSEAGLSEAGKQILERLSPLLKESHGSIMIEGHTDNKPIKSKRFPSNWELGASRAASVVHFLVSHQLEASRVRAISFADTRPIADNNSPEGREKNRRVNIVINMENN